MMEVECGERFDFGALSHGQVFIARCGLWEFGSRVKEEGR